MARDSQRDARIAAITVIYSTALGATLGGVSGVASARKLGISNTPAGRIVVARSLRAWGLAGMAHGIVAGTATLVGEDSIAVRLGAGGVAGAVFGAVQRSARIGAVAAVLLAAASATERAIGQAALTGAL